MAAPCDARMPRSVQSAGRCACGIAIGTQQKTTAIATSANTRLGGQPSTRGRVDGCREQIARHRQLGRLAQEDRRQRHHDGSLEQAEIEHGLPPAAVGDGALEHRRPDRAGRIGAARDQCQRRAAAAVEPAADIDVGRRVHGADAEEAHEQALAQVELPGLAAGRQREPDADHHGAEHDGPAHADPLGDVAHDDAAGAEADPGERARQRRDRAQARRSRRRSP